MPSGTRSIFINQFSGPTTGQMSRIGGHHWDVARLVTLAGELETFDLNLRGMCTNYRYDVSLREMVMHFNAVMDADLDHPIILDEDGEIMDGRHRLMKAIIDGKDAIKAVQFDINPEPDKRD
jgi:hypothetical protein